MAGLQRSAVSFRRQGSSGLVWEDRFLSGELNQKEDRGQAGQEAQQELEIKPDIKDIKTSRTVGATNTIERSRSNGGARGYRTGKVSPAIEPPSPKVSACGFCSAFGKTGKKGTRRTKPAVKHRSR
ncbi:MAPK kinase substrate protein At1g80180-like [Juglans microcarpa x Juglans regia]|uniref:MAPK kinase substrate protein At1g80180-like n=1 Tax=Juglans microcarpa x Juglans regia TaxID=2249226 RepID=UPI001B7DE32E|nr:MAPK kinase substrate protein At1g80180-like [Juglans microcarpa x Juglans regia]